MSLVVRRVETPAERAQLYAFRYRVYVQEFHLTEDADHDRRWLYDPLDEVGVSLAVFRDGDIVGCLRLVFMNEVQDLQPMIKKFDMGAALERFEPREITATSRFILDRALRHGKILFRLIKAGYEEGRKRGVRLNYGDCSPHQLAFYKHLGYRRYTGGYNDTAFGYKIPILMLVNDHAFLNQVRSPIARLAAESPDDHEARRWFERVYPDYVDLQSTALQSVEGVDRAVIRDGNNPSVSAASPQWRLAAIRGQPQSAVCQPGSGHRALL